MGPIQGVQPNPKAAPTSTGKAKLWLYWSVKILISLFINLKLITPREINKEEKEILEKLYKVETNKDIQGSFFDKIKKIFD